MSIATKRGDEGMTDLMYGRRISKSHPRVASYGAIDELNAALGLVRVSKGLPSVLAQVTKIQKQLIPLMGELATLTRNRVVPAGADERAAFELPSEPTPLQARAFELIGVSPASV